MAINIFEHEIRRPPLGRAGRSPRVISADAARGGPLGGRLLALMIVAIVLVVVASAALDVIYLYWR